MEKQDVKILIADDHPFTLMGTKTYIEALGYQITDLCSNGIHAYNAIVSKQPNIALLDVSMPSMNGLEVLEKMQKKNVSTKIILLTMHKELSVFNRARELDVAGYVLKEFATDVLEECIHTILNGDQWFSKELFNYLENDNVHSQNELTKLTFAEKKIIQLISKGYQNKEISELLFISERTVEGHRHSIIKKLNLPQEKNALLVWAMKNLY